MEVSNILLLVIGIMIISYFIIIRSVKSAKEGDYYGVSKYLLCLLSLFSLVIFIWWVSMEVSNSVLLAIGIMIIGYLIIGLVKSAKEGDYYGVSKYLLCLLGLFSLVISIWWALAWLIGRSSFFGRSPDYPDLEVFDFWIIPYKELPGYCIGLFIFSWICIFISFWIHRVKKKMW